MITLKAIFALLIKENQNGNEKDTTYDRKTIHRLIDKFNKKDEDSAETAKEIIIYLKSRLVPHFYKALPNEIRYSLGHFN